MLRPLLARIGRHLPGFRPRHRCRTPEIASPSASCVEGHLLHHRCAASHRRPGLCRRTAVHLVRTAIWTNRTGTPTTGCDFWKPARSAMNTAHSTSLQLPPSVRLLGGMGKPPLTANRISAHNHQAQAQLLKLRQQRAYQPGLTRESDHPRPQALRTEAIALWSQALQL